MNLQETALRLTLLIEDADQGHRRPPVLLDEVEVEMVMYSGRTAEVANAGHLEGPS